jgi:multiple sugar transport system permease protein
MTADTIVSTSPAVPTVPWYRRLTGEWLGYVLLSPAILLLVLLGLYPGVYAIVISFFQFRGGVLGGFIGLGNYARLVTDGHFWNSLRVLVAFAVCAVSLEFLLGFGLALFFSQELKLRALWRSFLIVPMIVTPVVVGLIWRLMLNPDTGVVNYFVRLLGFGPVEWLSRPFPAFVSIVAVDVWNWTPFVFLVLLAGLESLPIEPFEAARMDGAGPMRIFLDHTLPLMRPSILIALLIRTMDCLRLFDQVFVLTGGGPGNATEVLSLYQYRIAFKYFDQGYAAASLFLLLIVVVLISQAYIRLLRRSEVET